MGDGGAPLVDGDRLIALVGGEPDAKVMAFDKLTGKEIWRALSSDSEPGYGSPMIIEAAGVRQLIIFEPRGIDRSIRSPARCTGQSRTSVEMGMTVPTPVHSGPYLIVTSQYGGARMMKLDETKPGATLLWMGPGDSDREMTRRHAQLGDQHAGESRATTCTVSTVTGSCGVWTSRPASRCGRRRPCSRSDVRTGGRRSSCATATATSSTRIEASW